MVTDCRILASGVTIPPSQGYFRVYETPECWLSYLQLLSLPNPPLLLVTAGFPSGARLSLVLCGPLPTLQTSPPASGCSEMQPPFPCVAALLRHLPLSLSSLFPASRAAELLPHPAGKHAGSSGAASPLCSLASGTGLGAGRRRAPLCTLRLGSPSPGRASLRGGSSLPWKALPACDPSVTLPASACDPSAPSDKGAPPCLCL